MNNGMWRYRHAAALGLVALLAGCGGGGGGGASPTPPANNSSQCTLFYGLSGKVLDGSGAGVSGVYVTAMNALTQQVCSTSTSPTGSDGSYVLPIGSCGNATSVTVSAPLSNTTVSNNWSSCQPVNGVNLTPSTTSGVAAYQGTWSATYSSNLQTGGDSGSCSVVVNAAGVIDPAQNAKNCTSSISGHFTLTGALNDQGQFAGTTSSGASYIGQFDATNKSANGTWQNSGKTDNGPWQASLP